MDEKELMESIIEISGSEEKRIDTYLNQMQDFLKHSTHWTPNHDVFFQELQNEVRSSRKIKTYAFISLGVVLCVCILSIVVNIFLNKNKIQKEKIINDIKNSQFAVCLKKDANPNGLAVKIDENNFSENDQNQRKVAKMIKKEIPILGRHYGLGEDQLLKAKMKRLDPLEWLVFPKNDSQGIGLLRLNEKIDYYASGENPVILQRYIGFPNLPNFFFRIVTHKSTKNAVTWSVMFAEKHDNEYLWSNLVKIEKSPDGKILGGPFLITNINWNGFYIVSMGIGEYGEESKPLQAQAWNINSVVRRYMFDN